MLVILSPLVALPTATPTLPASAAKFASVKPWRTMSLAFNLKLVEPALEVVIESLSFQTQTALAIHQLEVLDLTPPVEAGQTREMMLFPWPQGYPLPPFYVSEGMGDVHTDHFINLGLRDRATNRRTAAAKRWYMKALAVPYQLDRFMLMWIAFEIMWKASDVSVEEHWKCDCGALLEKCPTCSRPTARQVRGASIRAFMERECSVSPEDARDLWRLRQVLHGDVDFDSALMGSSGIEVGELTA